MAYDLEEQEQLAELKAWWKRYGNGITTVVLIAAVTVAGYNLWHLYEARQSDEAAAVYDQLQKAVTAKNAAQVRDATGVLLDKYGRTTYAEMAALVAARSNLDAGDSKTAKAQLTWASEHAADDEYRWVAKLRLAAVLTDEGAYDDAQKAIAGDGPEVFDAAVADRRGDIDAAQGKIEDARREYQRARDKLPLAGESAKGYDRVIELKMDALGIGATLAKSDAAAAPSSPSAASATAAAPSTVQAPPQEKK